MSDAQPYTREELNFVTPMLSDFASSTPGPNQRLRECLLRLLATAKQGVEEKERDHRVRTTGPGPLLLRLCERFDALLSLDHRPARQASDVYDEAFHTAVHALHDLRAFARIISPTWRGAADTARDDGDVAYVARIVADVVRDREQGLEELRGEMERRDAVATRQLLEWEHRYNAMVEHIASGIAFQPPALIIIGNEGPAFSVQAPKEHTHG